MTTIRPCYAHHAWHPACPACSAWHHANPTTPAPPARHPYGITR